MVSTSIKGFLKQGFETMGLQVRRVPRVVKPFTDAFSDQVQLLDPLKVKTIFDVGANIGQITQRYVELFPSASIKSFEPFGSVYRELCGRVAHMENVQPFELAIADNSGPREFYVNRAHVNNSMLAPSKIATEYLDEEVIENIDKIVVAAMSLDDFCDTHDIQKIDILKMDIQGGELLALKGAERLLSSSCIDLIYTEVEFVELYEGQPEIYDLTKYLADYGFVLYGLYDLHAGKNGRLFWGDAIFVPEHRLSSA